MLQRVHRHICREILSTLAASIFVLVFIVLATKMIAIAEWIVSKGVNPFDVLKMSLCLLPSVILFALPAAVLMSVLIAFLRLSADNEIIAFQASGISIYQIMPPVLLIALLVAFFAAFNAAYLSPLGNKVFKDTVFNIAAKNAAIGIKERVFFEPFKKVTFYINSFGRKDKVMRNIFVVDNRDPNVSSTIIAGEGTMVSVPNGRSIIVELRNGTIFLIDRHFQAANMKFETYNLNIGLDDMIGIRDSSERNSKEMKIADLMRELQVHKKGSSKYNEVLIDLLEKISIPIAVFLMAIVGVPLGAQLNAGGRGTGIVVGLIVFLAYYICLAGSSSVCETGTISPFVGVWFPDFLLMAFVYVLFRGSSVRKLSGYMLILNNFLKSKLTARAV